MTGGSIAVEALGSTGCCIVVSVSLSPERLEFERNLLGPSREETLPLPLCLTEIYVLLATIILVGG